MCIRDRDNRQSGLVAGIELVEDWRTRKPWPIQKQVGIQICREMAALGVLTRPIGNVIVLMPPYCCSETQVQKMTRALTKAIEKLLGSATI